MANCEKGHGVRVVVSPSTRPAGAQKAPGIGIRKPGPVRGFEIRRTSPWPMYPYDERLARLELRAELNRN